MSEKSSGTIEIADLEVRTVRTLCEFLYTGKVEDTTTWESDDSVRDLLTAAVKYEVSSLVDLCTIKASTRLSVTNAAFWLLWAARFENAPLRQRCMEFVVANMGEIQDTEGWEQLTADSRLFAELAPELFRQLRPPPKKARNQ